MSAYAILGATGQTGGSILQLLGENPKNKINVLVRSRSKLEKAYPPLASNSNISVFEGSITDTSNLASCLKDTRAVFLTVAVSVNIPGVSVSMDTAKAVVSALQSLKTQDTAFKAPRLVILSSASLDDKFWRGAPSFVHSIMYTANAHIYDDLAAAERYLRQHEDWLDLTFVMPGGLTHDVQQGHELSETKQQTFISFLDLAAGMIEVADSGGEWEGKHVSVVLKEGRKAGFEWGAPLAIGQGLLFSFFPWLYRWLS
ncbi:NAD(P)-binding protein [Didymella exigua CBS 183.55]|uniref:NAD(P)-binding protein n=1 Tax=Didymella exigua CBS 183.55 TaxID=1150837 RepID=A0A6A5RTW5_9PLEO|nr:NAD(P)-binding protein [Didymella exigua CBS 183.55]KAF1931302.1 NAD(P)-binding protein [Didymella exigua CBS 183.55]